MFHPATVFPDDSDEVSTRTTVIIRGRTVAILSHCHADEELVARVADTAHSVTAYFYLAAGGEEALVEFVPLIGRRPGAGRVCLVVGTITSFCSCTRHKELWSCIMFHAVIDHARA